MDIAENKLSALTSGVLAKSEEYATRMTAYLPSILCDVGHYSTEAFLMRSFVSLRSDNDGDELAMTVDIRAQPETGGRTTISVESGLCLDNGTIVATGPSGKFDASSADFEVAIASWNSEFDVFLKGSEIEAITVLRKMIASANKASRKSSQS
jgi:hypothetical protein